MVEKKKRTTKANADVLSERYATPEMNEIFSEEGRIVQERELWIAVIRAARELGAKIPDGVIENYDAVTGNVDLQLIKEIELITRHDVKARQEAFNYEAAKFVLGPEKVGEIEKKVEQEPGDKNPHERTYEKVKKVKAAAGNADYAHWRMTSRDLTDNQEQMQNIRAARLVLGRYVSVLRHFLDKAEEYKDIEIAGRTHNQPGEITLLGRRFAMWAEELYFHIINFESFLDNYPLRGMKGPMGTQFDMLEALGSKEKVDQLERGVANFLGFREVIDAPGQVYPRSFDYALLNRLAELSSACENYAITMRLMAGYELVTEGFKPGQAGSSLMPHKMNTRSAERICSLSNTAKMYADGASRISGDQWAEGDVSCSAIRRVIDPDAFYTTDGIIETTLTVINEMGPYPAVIGKEIERYLPFLATTEIVSRVVEHGMQRGTAYDLVQKHAIAVALQMRERATQKNDLIHRLAADPEFVRVGVTEAELNEILGDVTHFVGNAHEQIDAVKLKCQPMLQKYAEAAKYEPYQIL